MYSQSILEQLQQDVAEVTAHNGLVLLTGDFNARTGEAADTLDADIAGDLLDNTLQPAVSTPLPLRKSADTKVCPFGKSLLNICQSSVMVIVNGRAKGDEMGAYTCHISKGSSAAHLPRPALIFGRLTGYRGVSIAGPADTRPHSYRIYGKVRCPGRPDYADICTDEV